MRHCCQICFQEIQIKLATIKVCCHPQYCSANRLQGHPKVPEISLSSQLSDFDERVNCVATESAVVIKPGG